MHSSSHGFQSKIVGAAFVLMLITIWLFLRGYHGLVGDARLYAFQALARIRPGLADDLYLQNTSQDQFTIFSPIYAWFIQILGLERAARSLTLAFTVWFLGAAWSAARALTSRDGAWLALGFLLITVGSYGGSDVFSFAQQFLTARLPAEAMIITSLVCYLRGLRLLAVFIAMAALFVHPLIALPGILLLGALRVPTRTSFIASLAIAIATLVFSSAATYFTWISNLFPVMNAAWLNVVQERSQFLFLKLWSFRDWELNARPFFYLAFIVLAIEDVRIRKICIAAALVGATGLTVALIANVVGPVAILVQGQAWRWVWITAAVSALLLPVTVVEIWQNKKCGPLCAILLISGMTWPVVDGTACVSLSLIIWLIRSNIPNRAAIYLHAVSITFLAAVVASVLIQSSGIVAAAIHSSGLVIAAQLRDIAGLKICVALTATVVWWFLRTSRTIWVPTLLSAILLALSALILPAGFKQSLTLASSTDINEFADWDKEIQTTKTVLVTPARDVGAFVWFILQRPNYLSVDQSAGVVFSQKTALEVQRRSDVLQPITDPNWKVLSGLRMAASGKRKNDASTRPLSALGLSQICADSRLGFVISPENVGFEPLSHNNAGPWNGWNLYDCSNVRALAPTK
jgi:hypothetical protein